MKAMPFHKGHEALIEYAKSKCDQLTILVGAREGEPIPLKYRLNWVSSAYLNDPKIVVLGDNISHPDDLSYDDLSVWWGKHILENFGKFDRVFSSEDYGDFFAKAMKAENHVFNIARTVVPISATMIRNKPLTNWEYLNSFAKDYFVKKICIVGSESTGKSTMAMQLAAHYDTIWSHEVGRELIPDTNECTLEDLNIVACNHASRIQKDTRKANKVLFVDTDSNITKSYAQHLFGVVPEWPQWVEKANEMDLYLYLNLDAPYVDDGTRLDEKQREQLHELHKQHYVDKNVSNLFFDEGYQARFRAATTVIDKFLTNF
jgi:HTH-type transcriptional repressor of NAD biosynthesis genes